MYEEHFRLRARPFGKTPDPAFLWAGRQHGEALARLEVAAADKDIALLTGEIGAGKTTLSRALVDRLDADRPGRFHIVLVINPRLSPSEMVELIAQRLGVDPMPKQKPRVIDALTERLYALYEQGKVPLVIVDEAHLITNKAVFEELRLLTNLQLDDAPLLGLLLIGQPELRDTLARPALQSFSERVGMAYHLRALDLDDTARYIAHRLAVAGRTEPLFQPDAIALVHRYSGGVPRRINTLCQAALLEAFGADAKEVSAAIVDNVRRDFEEHLGPLLGRVDGDASAPRSGRARTRRGGGTKPRRDDVPARGAS